MSAVSSVELRAFLVVGDGGCFFVVVCTQGPVLVVSDMLTLRKKNLTYPKWGDIMF